MNDKLDEFTQALAPISSLVPRQIKDRKVAQPPWTKQVVTIVGLKTVVNRFLPVSHEGYSNETYVDKIDLLGQNRAEFISRKMKGIERRMHMSVFREMVGNENGSDWRSFFEQHFGTTCIIPDGLCIACWNCSLFGGLDAKGQLATFSRVRYFDTFSIENTADCVGSMDNEEMGIGNQVYEDLVANKEGNPRSRGSETYHLYEYVKAGTRFPFITIIESPTLLDVAGLLHTIRCADAHGYGKYNANHGKFTTEFLAMATGYPRFSVLDMLQWSDEGRLLEHFQPGGVQFDSLRDSIVLFDQDIEEVTAMLPDTFNGYVKALDAVRRE